MKWLNHTVLQWKPYQIKCDTPRRKQYHWDWTYMSDISPASAMQGHFNASHMFKWLHRNSQ